MLVENITISTITACCRQGKEAHTQVG